MLKKLHSLSKKVSIGTITRNRKTKSALNVRVFLNYEFTYAARLIV